jgi:hypothetical protein
VFWSIGCSRGGGAGAVGWGGAVCAPAGAPIASMAAATIQGFLIIVIMILIGGETFR